jgi:hypothetical protein
VPMFATVARSGVANVAVCAPVLPRRLHAARAGHSNGVSCTTVAESTRAESAMRPACAMLCLRVLLQALRALCGVCCTEQPKACRRAQHQCTALPHTVGIHAVSALVYWQLMSHLFVPGVALCIAPSHLDAAPTPGACKVESCCMLALRVCLCPLRDPFRPVSSGPS